MPAITSSRADNFPIGALSKHSGVNVETIRYYERIKMLPGAAAQRKRPSRLWRDRPSHSCVHTALARTRVFTR
jgi:hypothetical protein